MRTYESAKNVFTCRYVLTRLCQRRNIADGYNRSIDTKILAKTPLTGSSTSVTSDFSSKLVPTIFLNFHSLLLLGKYSKNCPTLCSILKCYHIKYSFSVTSWLKLVLAAGDGSCREKLLTRGWSFCGLRPRASSKAHSLYSTLCNERVLLCKLQNTKKAPADTLIISVAIELERLTQYFASQIQEVIQAKRKCHPYDTYN